MAYTLKLLATLKKVYPSLFKDDPTSDFLKKQEKAIISGLWMYNILKKQKDEFSIFAVPESQNGIQEFKGAYVGIYFNNNSETQKAKDILNSYKFQKNSWEIFGLLPTNKKLQDELYEEPGLDKIINLARASRWASTVDPKDMNSKIEVLNYFLKKNNFGEKFNEQKYVKFFNNKIYFTFMKWFN